MGTAQDLWGPLISTKENVEKTASKERGKCDIRLSTAYYMEELEALMDYYCKGYQLL